MPVIRGKLCIPGATENRDRSGSSEYLPDDMVPSEIKLDTLEAADVKNMAGVHPAHIQSTAKFKNALGDPYMREKSEGVRDSFIRKQLQLSYLLHGASWAEINVKPSLLWMVTAALAERKQDILSVHPVAWSAILQRKNIVTVNSNHPGKRLLYIPPLVHFIICENNEGEIPKGSGPVLVILTSGSNGVEDAEEICCDLVKKNGIKITVLHGGDCKSVEVIQVELVNGCHILITTPPSFVRMLAFGERIFSFNRLQYFVMDEADILIYKFVDEMKHIFKRLTDALKVKRAVNSFQIVISAEKWAFGFDELVKKMTCPVICISVFMEAVVYSHLKPHIHLLSSSQKLPVLITLMKDRDFHRTVVVCNTMEEILCIQEAAEKQKLENVLVAGSSMPGSATHDLVVKWYSLAHKYPILICCDDIFEELRIENASRLIQYSLPERKKSFDYRFSCLLENFPSTLGEKTKKDFNPVIHIFVTDTDTIQLPQLVNFLKRLEVSVPFNLIARSEQAIVQKEHKKKTIPLCPNIKLFGECWRKLTCSFRHIVINSDMPPVVRIFSVVKVKIFASSSACDFAARILECTDEEGNTVLVHNRHMEVMTKLQDYFKDDNKSLVVAPKVHGFYARKTDERCFKRVRVVAYAELGKDGEPVEVYVNDVDDGAMHLVNVSRLYELSEELKSIPRQSVQLLLCNLCPSDRDWKWSNAAHRHVDQILREAEGEGRYLRGRVQASLVDCIWVEPLDCIQSFPTLKTHYEVFSVRSRLIKEGVAVENPQHIKLLHEVLKGGGISICEEKKNFEKIPTLKTEQQPEDKFEPQWAFLSSDEYHSVTFVTGDDPSRFFLRHAKFEDLLEKLSKKLAKLAEDKHSEQSLKNPLIRNDYCIGRYADGTWCRAFVLKTVQDQLDLFFVDYGDVGFVNRSDAFRAPVEVFTQLPFQAIECELACIRSPGKFWPDTAYDALFEEANDPKSEALYAKVVGKHKAQCTGGYKYSIVLVDVREGEKCVLNQVLAEKRLAVQSEEERRFLDGIDLSEISLKKIEDDDEDSETGGLDSGLESDAEEIQGENITQVDPVSQRQLANDNTEEENIFQVEQMKVDLNLMDVEDTMEYFMSFMRHLEKKPDLNCISSGENSLAQNMNEDSVTNFNGDCSESSKESTEVDTCAYMPRLVYAIKHPTVIWRQDNFHVWLEVDVCGVKDDYLLQAEHFKLVFCTCVNEELCGFIMHLWGAINPKNVGRKSGGLRFIIKLQKLLVGVRWTQLLKNDKKAPWLKYDVGCIEGEEEESEDEVLQRSREEAPRIHETILKANSDSEEEEDDVPGDPFLSDPYDPFN